MTKSHRAAALLCSTVAVVAGCAAGEEASPPAADGPAASAHAVVGSFVMRVQPRERRAEIRRLPVAIAGGERVAPQAFSSLPIVSDDVTGSGPADTVELATLTTTNTYGTGASGSCPAGSFCGDVQLMHFFQGLGLSAVYVQVTAITDANGDVDTAHPATNGVSSTPFGIDVSLGAWLHTPLPSALAAKTPATKTWSFQNPDNQDFYVYLDVKAAKYPTLWFGKNGLTQTAPLVAGSPLTLHYEYARNTGCSGATNHVWNAFLKATNIDVQQVSFQSQAADTSFDVEITTPFGGGVDFWFNKQEIGGGSCVSWDSNNGGNYNVGITNPLPAIHLGGPNSNVNPYWTTAWNKYHDSGVVGGAAITVDYELDRLQCLKLDRYRRLPPGTFVKMGYAFDGGAYTEVPITGVPSGVPTAGNGVTGDMLVPPVITIPQGSHYMHVYFYTNASTCTYPSNYDSNYGQNWKFAY